MGSSGGRGNCDDASGAAVRQVNVAMMLEVFDAEVTVRRARYASDETGFAVLDVDADGDEVVLVGPLIHLEARDRARVRGQWVTDSRYGPQVKVTEALPLPPADADTVISYLRRIKHVGPQRATRLLERHGVGGVLETIDRDPSRRVPGGGDRRTTGRGGRRGVERAPGHASAAPAAGPPRARLPRRARA